MKNKRDITIDIFKGILILFVVIGHCPMINSNIKNIIYWFHMPLFFTLSGYLFKPSKDYKNLLKNFKKYLILYFSYFLIISLFLEQDISINKIIRFLYGGRVYGGVYWFIPSLILTILLFNIIVSKFSPKKTIIIILIMGILSNLESLFFIPNNTDYYTWSFIYKMPLNIDVYLLSIVYFMIGYYSKELINKVKADINKFMLILSISVSISFIYLYINDTFNFYLDMKYSKYENLVLSIIIPILIGYILLTLSVLLKKYHIGNILSILGKRTIPIMYLHIPLNEYFMNKLSYNSFIIYCLIGIVIPLIVSYLCSRNNFLNGVFNGFNIDVPIRNKSYSIE